LLSLGQANRLVIELTAWNMAGETEFPTLLIAW